MKNQKQTVPSLPSQYELDKKDHLDERIEEQAGFVSRLLFCWTNSIMIKGFSKPYQYNDLFDIREDQEPQHILQEADSVMAEVLDQMPDSIVQKKILTRTIYQKIKWNLYLSMFLAVISNACQFAGPYMIKAILAYLNSPLTGPLAISNSLGYGYCAILTGCYIIRSYLLQHSLHIVNYCSVLAGSIISLKVYQKVLKLSQSSMKYYEAGKISNLLTVDAKAVQILFMMITFVATSPVMIIVTTALIILQLGPIGIVVPFLLFLGIISQNFIMKRSMSLRKQILGYMDKRTKLVNQNFTGVRILKYYGWEPVFVKAVAALRVLQNALNIENIKLRGLIETILNVLPILISMLVFAVYSVICGVDSTGRDSSKLTAAKVYTVLSLFNIIQTPLRLLVLTIVFFIDAKASMGRIEKYYGYPQRKQREKNEQYQRGAISIKGLQASYEQISTKLYHQDKQQSLQNQSQDASLNKIDEIPPDKIALTVQSVSLQPGSFTCVIGEVGSGKSTLINAILNELNILKGEVRVGGKIALVPQNAWLLSATVRQNIVFHSQFQQQKYRNILKICQLQADLNILAGKDMTEVGQRGINLSGGQKQRISLARALYMNADLYLIDDCLSALDHEVGRKIYENVIRGFLRSKTILFVTHALQYVNDADWVLVLKDGKVVEQDSVKNLQRNGTYYRQLKAHDSHEQVKEQQKESSLQNQVKKVQLDKSTGDGAMVKIEERTIGEVEWGVYVRYFLTAGVLLNIMLLLLLCASQGSRMVSDWWVGAWSNNSFKYDDFNTYIWIYSIITVVVGLTILLRGYAFAYFITYASQGLQSSLINKLVRSPLSWFDVTPLGRILSRTSKDQDNIDNLLAFNLQNTLTNFFILVGTLILNGVVNPYYFIIAGVALVLFYFSIKFYLISSREIKRLDDNSRSPLITHLQETIQGLVSIRSANMQDVFFSKFLKIYKQTLVPFINNNSSNRFISLLSDFFAIVMIAATAFLGVASKSDNTSVTNMVGLSILWSLNLSSIISFTLKTASDTQNCMNSVLRITHYIDNNPQEADFDQPKAPQQWPSQGSILLQNISYKYRPELQLVIDSVSFDIQPFEKIGVVGRTGSGKSTLTLGMLRILQLSENNKQQIGSIVVDGVRLSELGLHQIRHKVTMIPQEPVLFSGDIRSNIDPFENHSDAQVIQVLKKSQIFGQIEPNKEHSGDEAILKSKVEVGGSNFSQGQRQLICIARALIRKPKVLIMDQATASIDQMTDKILQNMIRTQFKKTTVITIAHRLNTIIQYDRIVVLKEGKVEQSGRPAELLAKKGGYFSQMVGFKDAAYRAYLQKLAEGKN